MKKEKDQVSGISEAMLDVNKKVMKGDQLTEHEAKLRQYHEQYGLMSGAQKFIENVVNQQPTETNVEDPDPADSGE